MDYNSIAGHTFILSLAQSDKLGSKELDDEMQTLRLIYTPSDVLRTTIMDSATDFEVTNVLLLIPSISKMLKFEFIQILQVLIAISANSFWSCDLSSTLMYCIRPVYTLDQYFIIASQTLSVVILGRKRAAEKCLASSTMCSTGLPSRYIMSMQTFAWNRIFSCFMDTRNPRGAFCIL